MSAGSSNKKPCAMCTKSSGIFACQGCEKMFCGKHAIDHRHELNGQLDIIASEHDMLQQELAQPSMKKNSILEEIDKWEKDSIAKIQAAAEAARKTLEESLQKSKEKVKKACQDVAEQLNTSREADDFTEKDLERWKKQLEELLSEIQSPTGIQLKFDRRARIKLISLQVNGASTPEQNNEEKIPPPKMNLTDENLQEFFLQTLGPIKIEEDGALIKSIDSCKYARGQLLYSSGCFMIRFQIENFDYPYRIFFGCMSSKYDLSEDVFRSSGAAGWFGSNQVYQNGLCNINCQTHGYNSTKIQVKDVLRLILDCTNKQIMLHNERLGKTCTISVNVESAPFPWQLLVILGNAGDSVRILSNAA